jgi:glycosyltransferase involved in cell wall biosynthesis
VATLKVLTVHNFYQQPGGEDQVFRNEANALEARGHTVLRWTETNDRINGMNPLRLAAATIWNSESHRTIRELVERERPDVVHFHNTFPLISPSALYAARSAGAAVVKTIHNYRLMCPGALFLRDGAPCELCLGDRLPWKSVEHACYRGSRAATSGIASMLAIHGTLGTWHRAVDAYIMLTEFSRSKFIEGGFPAERLFVKPNFASPDPGPGPGGETLLFAGRLSVEKGISTMLDAWRLDPGLPPIDIAGDGPLADLVRNAAASDPRIRWLGHISKAELTERMKRSLALVFPSVYYESCPMTIIEAYATGLPVIASDMGAMAELVKDGICGKLFRPSDSRALSGKISELQDNQELVSALRQGCRREFEVYYREDRNVSELLNIYAKATVNRASKVLNRSS